MRPSKPVSLRFAALALTAWIVAMDAASAEDSARTYQIAEQSLGQALREFALASNVDLLFSPDLVAGKKSVTLDGKFTVDEGLRTLLRGSGLEFSVSGSRVVIGETKSPPARQAIAPTTSAASGTNGYTRLAQAEAGPRPSDSSSSSRSSAEPSDTLSQERIELEEIVVTGTHIRGRPPIGTAITIVDREAIEESGYSGLAAYAEFLPQNFTGVSQDFSQLNTSNVNRGTEIQLRGLGPGTTLTLLDGQRLAGGGTRGAFVDVSTIPTAAIERVEILADGASALYGSDAIGGVVNVRLRRDFDGVEARIRLSESTNDAQGTQASLVFGRKWSSGNFLIGYQRDTQDALVCAEALYCDTDGDMRAFGGDDFRQAFSNPGNVVSTAGVVLFSIPTNQDGFSLTPADFIPGQVNFQVRSPAYLLPEQNSQSLFLSFSQGLTSRFELGAFAQFFDRDSFTRDTGAAAILIIPTTNPFYVNPAGPGSVRIAYDFGRDLGNREQIGSTTSQVFGLRGVLRLGDDWSATASLNYGEQQDDWIFKNQVNTTALAAALNSTDPLTAFNPFGDGSFTNPQVLAGIRLQTFEEGLSTTYGGRVVLDGPLFALGGRDVRLALGTEIRMESLDVLRTSGAANSERDVASAFVELAIPIWTGTDASFINGADISVAARHDDYSDFGSTLNPKIGAQVELFDALRLRSSWGTSFRAPPFYLSNLSLQRPSAFGATIPDPGSPPTSLVLIESGGSSSLTEETSETFVVGGDFRPTPSLNFSISYFEIEYKDKIQLPASGVLSVLPFEGQFAGTGVITRNPSDEAVSAICTSPGFIGVCTGPYEAIIDLRYRNLAQVDVKGVDISGSASFETSIGTLTTGVSSTHLFSYEQAVTPASPIVEVVNTVGNPPSWRARGTFGWAMGNINAIAAVNFTSEYEDRRFAPARDVEASLTFDFTVRYDLSDTFSVGRGTEIILAATNLTDETPPFVNDSNGYDGANANPVGRTVSFQAVQRW